ncbi:hypothetical protein F4861DRAFT_536885 [Xylaria intraflava]|nr:hypothetical protein F4861DRAFT_536885 [Xylaria intraflava]
MVKVMETTSTAGTGTLRKHCWECQRRRLVCDSAQPACNRCRKNGVECPGYSETKPLRWVKPGRVTTRNRRRQRDGSSLHVGPIQYNTSEPASSTSKDSSGDGELQDTVDALSFLKAAQSTVLDSIMRYDITCDDPARIEALYICKSFSPESRIHSSFLNGMELYNCCSPLTLLVENNARYTLPPVAVAHFLPAPIKGLFVLLALGHKMYTLPRDAKKEIRARARSAVAFWAYQVVRTLNEQITSEKTVSDATISAVIMLLWEDQQYHPSTRWRFHFSGLMRMAQLRGGIKKLWHNSPHMQNAILTMAALEAFANTTSPSHDQLSEVTHPNNLTFIQAIWEIGTKSTYVGSICPLALFASVLKTNHLRALSIGSTDPTTPLSPSDSAEDNIIYSNAKTIVEEIKSFSAPAYAEKNGNERTRDKWLLVARIHQSAVLLYTILSLQSIAFLPETAELARVAAAQYDQLLLDLKEGFRHTHLRNCLFWPLMVAGVRAVCGTAFERAFLADLLAASAGDMGGAMPILARATLLRFWDSGKEGWDDCFDRPFLFIS